MKLENQESNDEKQTVFNEEEQINNANEGQRKTSSGMDENMAGFLCYLVGFITGIIFLVTEKENQFVRYHAMQSIITFGGLFVINIVLGMIPILGWLAMLFMVPLTFIVWIVLMLKAFNGKLYKLPIAGNIAEKQLNQMKG